MFSTPLGVIFVLVLNNAIVSSRKFLDEEIAYAAGVFGGSLDFDRVRLTDLRPPNPDTNRTTAGLTLPGVDGYTYISLGSNYREHSATDAPLLVHELVHAWQLQHKTFTLEYLLEGATISTRNSDDVYRYDLRPDSRWEDFHFERKAKIIEEWFSGQAAFSVNPMPGRKPQDVNDPAYRFVIGAIWTPNNVTV